MKVVFVMIFTEVPWPCFHFNTSCMNNILLVAMRTFSGPLFLCLSSLLNHLLSETFITIGLWLLSSFDVFSLLNRFYFNQGPSYLLSMIPHHRHNLRYNCFFAVIDAIVLFNHRSFFFPLVPFLFLTNTVNVPYMHVQIT